MKIAFEVNIITIIRIIVNFISLNTPFFDVLLNIILYLFLGTYTKTNIIIGIKTIGNKTYNILNELPYCSEIIVINMIFSE